MLNANLFDWADSRLICFYRRKMNFDGSIYHEPQTTGIGEITEGSVMCFFVGKHDVMMVSLGYIKFWNFLLIVSILYCYVLNVLLD